MICWSRSRSHSWDGSWAKSWSGSWDRSGTGRIQRGHHCRLLLHETSHDGREVRRTGGRWRWLLLLLLSVLLLSLGLVVLLLLLGLMLLLLLLRLLLLLCLGGRRLLRDRPPGMAEVVEAAEAPLIFPASYQGRGDRRADALSHQKTEDERTGTGRYDFVGRCGRSDSQDGRGCRSRWCRTKASNRKCRSRNDGR